MLSSNSTHLMNNLSIFALLILHVSMGAKSHKTSHAISILFPIPIVNLLSIILWKKILLFFLYNLPINSSVFSNSHGDFISQCIMKAVQPLG